LIDKAYQTQFFHFQGFIPFLFSSFLFVISFEAFYGAGLNKLMTISKKPQSYVAGMGDLTNDPFEAWLILCLSENRKSFGRDASL